MKEFIEDNTTKLQLDGLVRTPANNRYVAKSNNILKAQNWSVLKPKIIAGNKDKLGRIQWEDNFDVTKPGNQAIVLPNITITPEISRYNLQKDVDDWNANNPQGSSEMPIRAKVVNNDFTLKQESRVIGMSNADPIAEFIVGNAVLGKPLQYLAKTGLNKILGKNRVVYNTMGNTSKSSNTAVDYKDFFHEDVLKRAKLDGNKFNDKWFEYEPLDLSKFGDEVQGIYNIPSRKVYIREGSNSTASKVHEFRHKLDYQNPLSSVNAAKLEHAYPSNISKIPSSKLMDEKVATNTELRFDLYSDYINKYNKKPSVYQLDKYIDKHNNDELLTKLEMVNNYGRDYRDNIDSYFFKVNNNRDLAKTKNIKIKYVKDALKTIPVVLPIINKKAQSYKLGGEFSLVSKLFNK